MFKIATARCTSYEHCRNVDIMVQLFESFEAEDSNVKQIE